MSSCRTSSEGLWPLRRSSFAVLLQYVSDLAMEYIEADPKRWDSALVMKIFFTNKTTRFMRQIQELSRREG